MDFQVSKLVAIFLKLLYGPLAWAYDFIAYIVSFGEWHNWTKQIEIFLSKNEKILEVGIGTSALQKELLQKGFQIYGCDLSKKMLRISSGRLNSLSPRIIQADNKELPLKDNYFFKVISTFPSDYVLSEDFICECKRVLRENGEIIILLSVIFPKNDLISVFYRNLYNITGQSNSKIVSENIINTQFTLNNNVSIHWIPYRNVELCFLILKNR